MTDNWTVTLPCTRREAEALGQDWEFLSALDPVPTIVGEEVVAFDDNSWRIVAYFDRKPSKQAVAALQSQISGGHEAEIIVEKLPEEDWLVMSQQGLAPVHAGRFFVHSAEFDSAAPTGAVPFIIPASQAFGTGGHETTSGCLAMLDQLKRQGRRYGHIADIGTGTGLLAFAAQHLWHSAYVTASDIDPVSIDVTARNAAINNLALGQGKGRISLCAAMGTDHEMIQRRAPYDLVIANILAGPLIELAPSFAEIIRRNGSLILAGLLDVQADNVLRQYRRHGFSLIRRRDEGDWPCLHLIKRRRYGWRRPLRPARGTSQPPGDYGTW
ncbi:50S ribosomal protein L11 methyltransferase [Sphingorhabdus arenilitoris]|uniref:Ribosomal protein L11 methyltransferase n=1 Tax=Sphingorhabdus arenilitoris TaxID=1490041 RepID=A0ABV8RIY2_9SPHN